MNLVKQELALQGKNQSKSNNVLSYVARSKKGVTMRVSIYKEEEKALLQTSKGKYRLLKQGNMYKGLVDGIKAQVSATPLTGRVTFWA